MDARKIVDILPYLTAFGVISGFLLAAVTLWRNERTRRVSNYLTLVGSHRSIWSMLFQYNELELIFSNMPLDHTRAITKREEMFISFVILNLSATYEMMRTDSIVTQPGLQADLKSFFSNPIPKRIWEETKRFHNDSFIKFVDQSL